MTGQVREVPSTEDRYGERFTRDEAAAILAVNVRTLDRWIAERRLGHVRLGGRVWITGYHLDEFWRDADKQPRRTWVQPSLFEAFPQLPPAPGGAA